MSMLYTVTNKQRVTKIDSDFTLIIFRIFSNRIAHFLAPTPITPNQITILRSLLCLPPILYFFARGDYWSNLTGLGFIFVVMIFDLVDGELARIKNMATAAGKWLDTSLDQVFQVSLLCAVAIGVARSTGNEVYYIIGFFMVFGQSIANIIGFIFERDFGFDAYAGSERFYEFYNHVPKISVGEWFLKNIIVPNTILFRTIFCCSYMLFVAIVINQLTLFLWVFAITINIRWLTMFGIYFMYLLKGPRQPLALFRILDELQNKSTSPSRHGD